MFFSLLKKKGGKKEEKKKKKRKKTRKKNFHLNERTSIPFVVFVCLFFAAFLLWPMWSSERGRSLVGRCRSSGLWMAAGRGHKNISAQRRYHRLRCLRRSRQGMPTTFVS